MFPIPIFFFSALLGLRFSTLKYVGSINLGKPGCTTQCGTLKIPYPFGINSACSFNSSFVLDCDYSVSPPKTYLSAGTYRANDVSVAMEVLAISEMQVRIKTPMVASVCYDLLGNETKRTDINASFASSPFTLSANANKMTLIGCDIYGNIGKVGLILYFGCESHCSRIDEVKQGCTRSTGNGCCQNSVHFKMNDYYLNIFSVSGYDGIRHGLEYNPCSYTLVGDASNFTFRGVSDLKDPTLGKRIVDSTSIVLDWRIGNQSCSTIQNGTGPQCYKNSHCFDSKSASGYLCICNSGFHGNPYLEPGCQDIDECKMNNTCTNICVNTEGFSNCSCPHGYTGDGRKNGTGCSKNPSSESSIELKIPIGLGIGAFAIVVCLTLICYITNNRRLVRQRQKFFKQNGGFLLKERLSTLHKDVSISTKIFTEKELKGATNNYENSCILGQGGSGIVYKGIQQDKRVIAIKKSRFIDNIQIEDFINEVFILTQINHRNVVKLLGCCLETEVPLLVYEYVPKGTLCNHIDQDNDETFFTWDHRLRISIEAASALSYLHSAISTPIIHRDVKSTNILLDDCYVAKISDFGASRLLSLDQTRVITLVQGTLGYLDPEYYRTGNLTEKSDVYSFGVVLAELVTGKKPILDQEAETTLANLLIKSVMENSLFQILEHRVRMEGSFEQLQEFANLIVHCLNQDGIERPKMREVVIELERIKGLTKNNLLVQHQVYKQPGVDSTKEPYSDLYTQEQTC